MLTALCECACPPEAAVDRQISFPLSNILQVNGERSSQPLLHDFTEDIQFMDIEETSGKEPVHISATVLMFLLLISGFGL